MTTRRRLVPAAFGLLVLILLLGPRERFVERWVVPDLGADPAAYVAAAEASVPGLRAGDEKEIVWDDPNARSVTPVSLVYLHGFSADRHEVEPLVSLLGRRLGANVYFTRLAGHGRGEEAMAEADVEDWLADAAEAITIGSRIGRRVVVVATSTGATLAIWAASRPEGREQIAALALISPNLQPADHMSRLLLWPWGGLIARVVVGPQRCFDAVNPDHAQHWTTCYPTSALLPMMALADGVRRSDPSAIRTPTYVAYSPEDEVVDAREIKRWFDALTVPERRLSVVADSGDPSLHVHAGAILSPSTTDRMADEILAFLGAIDIEPGTD